MTHSAGMAYTSGLRILGPPVIQVRGGSITAGVSRRGVARGWFAVGDVALGALFAAGGLAVGGGLGIGGASVGLLGLGGFAVGGLAFGGAAVGVYAIGGLAIGVRVALGGLAIARDIALGGTAIAQHVGDDEARAYFGANPIYRLASDVSSYTWQLLGLPLLLSIGFRRRSGGPGSGGWSSHSP